MPWKVAASFWFQNIAIFHKTRQSGVWSSIQACQLIRPYIHGHIDSIKMLKLSAVRLLIKNWCFLMNFLLVLLLSSISGCRRPSRTFLKVQTQNETVESLKLEILLEPFRTGRLANSRRWRTGKAFAKNSKMFKNPPGYCSTLRVLLIRKSFQSWFYFPTKWIWGFKLDWCLS